jgi:hypothetical protein
MLHLARSEYFPSVKNIMDMCVEIANMKHREREHKQLMEPEMTPEQIKQNADRARAIVKGIGKVA